MTLNTSSSRILRGWWEVLTKTIKEFCPLILWVHQQKNFESQHLSRRRRICSLKQNFSRRSAIDPLHSKIMMQFLNTVLYTSLGILTMRIFSKNQELIACAIVYFHDHKVWFKGDAARGVGCPSLLGVKGSGYFSGFHRYLRFLGSNCHMGYKSLLFVLCLTLWRTNVTHASTFL